MDVIAQLPPLVLAFALIIWLLSIQRALDRIERRQRQLLGLIESVAAAAAVIFLSEQQRTQGRNPPH